MTRDWNIKFRLHLEMACLALRRWGKVKKFEILDKKVLLAIFE